MPTDSTTTDAWAVKLRAMASRWKMAIDVQAGMQAEEIQALTREIDGEWEGTGRIAHTYHPVVIADMVDSLEGMAAFFESVAVQIDSTEERLQSLEAKARRQRRDFEALAGAVRDNFRAVRSVAHILCQETEEDFARADFVESSEND